MNATTTQASSSVDSSQPATVLPAVSNFTLPVRSLQADYPDSKKDVDYWGIVFDEKEEDDNYADYEIEEEQLREEEEEGDEDVEAYKFKIKRHYIHIRNLFQCAHHLQTDPEVENKTEIMREVVSRAEELMNRMYQQEYEECIHQCDFSESVKTTLGKKGLTDDDADKFMMMMEMLGQASVSKASILAKMKDKVAPKPSSLSSKLARFSPEYTAVKDKYKEYAANPQALNVFLGACIRKDLKLYPIEWCTSTSLSGDMLVTTGGYGHSNSKPYLCVTNLSNNANKSMLFSTGFKEVSEQVVADSDRNLVWVTGDDTFKAFSLDESPRKEKYTLFAGQKSSLLVTPEKIFGGDHNGAEIKYWNVSELVENGEVSKASTGRACSDSISLGKTALHAGIDKMAQLYCSKNRIVISPQEYAYHLMIYDLQKQAIVRYAIGHTSSITKLCTTPYFPNLMATASRDRTAKVWDSRTVQCALTLEGHASVLNHVELVSLNGTPFAFTGGVDERIKVWDIRLQKPLYELSTGNNTVRGLHWHYGSNSIVAVTECPTLNRHGERNLGNSVDFLRDYDDDDDDDDDEEVEKQAPWPKTAYHTRTDFEEFYDNSYHAAFMYQFSIAAPSLPAGITADNQLVWSGVLERQSANTQGVAKITVDIYINNENARRYLLVSKWPTGTLSIAQRTIKFNENFVKSALAFNKGSVAIIVPQTASKSTYKLLYDRMKQDSLSAVVALTQKSMMMLFPASLYPTGLFKPTKEDYLIGVVISSK